MIAWLWRSEMVRWGLKSAFALGINIGLLTIWVEAVGVAPSIAALLNAVIIPPAMYVVVDRWVFERRSSPTTFRGHCKQFAGMYTANGVGKVGNYVIYLLLLHIGVIYQAAWVIGAVVMFLGSFTLNRRWWEDMETDTKAA